MTRLPAALVLALLASSQSSFASPVGLWKAHDGAVIRIKQCGRNLCGFVVRTNPAIDVKTGSKDYSDKYNMDAGKRHRSRIGIEVLISMKRTDHSKWSGQLYNDRNGRTYRGDLLELSSSEIEIEGCWLFFCGGERLTRVNQ